MPLPTQFKAGVRRFFGSSSSSSAVQIFKRPYFIALKVLLVIAAIAFVVIGLFMIDESCGCVRAQDKQMMLMLKIHVGLGILMLIVSLFMSEMYPRTGILIILAILLAILGIDSWIFYNYKRCIGNTDLAQSDKRFLSWLVTTMVVSGALSLATLLLIGVLINRYGKGQVIQKTAENLKSVDSDYRNLINTIDERVREKIDAYQNFAIKLGVIKDSVSVDKNKLLDKIPPEKIIQNLEDKRLRAENSDLQRGYEKELKNFELLKEGYKFYLEKKNTLNKAAFEKTTACNSSLGFAPKEPDCTNANVALKRKIIEIQAEIDKRSKK